MALRRANTLIPLPGRVPRRKQPTQLDQDLPGHRGARQTRRADDIPTWPGTPRSRAAVSLG